MRIGIGYDVHALVAGRPLVLGGVTIPSERGLDGHSDADALLHAVADALLGAASLGDIGQHFPDSDPAYRNISSLRLLEAVVERLEEHGFQVGNVDAVVIAESPKLAPYIPRMRTAMAKALRVPETAVSVKATTHERLGSLGRGEGIAAQAVCLLNGKGTPR
ncbi:MAG TPA: 2-C-methyl-D-erythritol 2,4-cyclodiphosphate synthase [Nitrospiria bacterium]|nr:2-C-methyl-D-erythritol 2,4-cyclodiphosphate synthase [Nitrospiria bacterium]